MSFLRNYCHLQYMSIIILTHQPHGIFIKPESNFSRPGRSAENFSNTLYRRLFTCALSVATPFRSDVELCLVIDKNAKQPRGRCTILFTLNDFNFWIINMPCQIVSIFHVSINQQINRFKLTQTNRSVDIVHVKLVATFSDVLLPTRCTLELSI